jgi:hypothetical protein
VLQWDSNVGDAFPELADSMRPEYRVGTWLGVRRRERHVVGGVPCSGRWPPYWHIYFFFSKVITRSLVPSPQHPEGGWDLSPLSAPLRT